MGKTLDGAAAGSAGGCDSRCTQHKPGQVVSQRTRNRCTERIELSLRKQAALRRQEAPEPSTAVSKPTPPLQAASDTGIRSLADDLDVELDPPPPDDPDNLDDTISGRRVFQRGRVETSWAPDNYCSTPALRPCDPRVARADADSYT
ncbi:hypothetical protein FRC08_016143 [Ceratobasidium sp. 394]|nr:hypothetical protein FRC08_016143 [Ceratobasidium sp. 394]